MGLERACKVVSADKYFEWNSDNIFISIFHSAEPRHAGELFVLKTFSTVSFVACRNFLLLRDEYTLEKEWEEFHYRV